MLVQQLSLLLPQLLRPAPPASQLGAFEVEPAQASAVQLPVTQGQGVPHWPVESQVWMEPVPEHCWVPGVQTPESPPLLEPELLPLEEPELLPELLPLLEPELP